LLSIQIENITLPIEIRNSIERTPPKNLSSLNIRLTQGVTFSKASGMSGGSIKNFVPERKMELLNIMAFIIS
jgi:hypothetical protein